MLQLSPDDLSQIECWQLLSPGGIGRLALTTGALPAIVPVRFEATGDNLLVCLGDRPDLATAVDNNVVAFEADSFLGDGDGGWSVHLNGIARVESDSSITPACSHSVPPLVARISDPILTGSRYLLCDTAGATTLSPR